MTARISYCHYGTLEKVHHSFLLITVGLIN